jgi:signal transduction histidine kinase
MTPHPLLGSGRLRRLWTSRFWILATVLGAITLYTLVATIHDNDRRAVGAGLITQATAMHVSALASGRLERLALEAFAPAGPLAIAPLERSVTQVSAEALARRQRQGETCACRDLLPATKFFRFDVAGGAVAVAPVEEDARPVASAPPDSLLAELAQAESRQPRGTTTASSRLVVDPRLGDKSVVLLVQRDDPGDALAVYGIVVDTRETLTALFAHGPPRSAIDSAGLTRLDSLSFEVRATAGGQRLFGSLGSGRVRALVHLGGPLRGLVLTIAVAPGRIASPLLVPRSRGHLWSLGALLAATILMIGIAASYTRREVLLARARSDFIAGVSHDLRMPLAQILIASETLTLRRERSDTERVSLASSIVRETRRLMALVDNVLLFSRSGAVELRPSLRPVPVAELLADVADAVRLAVEDAGQAIDISPAPGLSVIADTRLVRQALVNLVDNALKYGAEGQHIRLGARADGGRVQLYVEDEGPGVPPAERERIFEPYERLSHDQTSERTGTGLGLAVVRQIARACDGRVWLEPGRERGARAVLELRAAAAPAPFPATPEIA